MKVLQDFGGLRVEQRGPGVNCARESFWIDPSRAVGEDDRFAEVESITGKLFPIGEAFNGYDILAMNASGAVFAVMDDVHLVGRDFAEALDHLVRGVTPIEVEV